MKIGNEYYMTKGHYHQHIDTLEVYYGLSGEGYMLMENMEGDGLIMDGYLKEITVYFGLDTLNRLRN